MLSRALQDCFKHLENIRAVHCVSCSKIFLRAGNNPVVLKNSSEHAEPLFIGLLQSQTATCHGLKNLCNRCKKSNQALQLVLHGASG